VPVVRPVDVLVATDVLVAVADPVAERVRHTASAVAMHPDATPSGHMVHPVHAVAPSTGA